MAEDALEKNEAVEAEDKALVKGGGLKRHSSKKEEKKRTGKKRSRRRSTER